MYEWASHAEVESSDAELITLVRTGEAEARAELFTRHRDAAMRLAARLGGPHNADDLVSESFSRVFAAMDAGGGPDLAFRPYLLATVRNTYVTYVRTDSRHLWVDDFSTVETGSSLDDETELRSESSLLATAFRSLPERWQSVLWHTTVEQESPADVAVLLGMTPGAVAALSFRAREGLRQAYLAEHMQSSLDPECADIRPNLPAYVRGRARQRLARQIEDHLDECCACALVLVELEDVGANLGAALAPAILGIPVGQYLAAGKAGTGLLFLLGKFRYQTATAATVGVVAVAAAVAAPWNGAAPAAPHRSVDAGASTSTPAPTPSTPTTKPPARITPPSKASPSAPPRSAVASRPKVSPPSPTPTTAATRMPPVIVELNIPRLVKVKLLAKPPRPPQSNAHPGGKS